MLSTAQSLRQSLPVADDRRKAHVNRSPYSWMVFVCVTLTSMGAMTVGAAPLFAPFPVVAYDVHKQTNPAVDKEWIIWVDDRDYPTGSHNHVYGYNLTNGRVQRLTQTEGYRLDPQVDRGYVVWADARDSNLDVYALDIATRQEVRVTAGESDETHPDISYPWVVYQSDVHGKKRMTIWAYNLETHKAQQLTPSDEWHIHPAIGGRLAAWTRIYDLAGVGATWVANSTVHAQDLDTGESRSVSGGPAQIAAQQSYVTVDYPFIVWQDNRDGNKGWDLFAYDWLKGKERRLVGDQDSQVYPQFRYPNLLWLHAPHGDEDPYRLMYRNISVAGVESRFVVEPGWQSSEFETGPTHVAWVFLRPQGGEGAQDIWAMRVRNASYAADQRPSESPPMFATGVGAMESGTSGGDSAPGPAFSSLLATIAAVLAARARRRQPGRCSGARAA